ncbi:hypothetical protein FRC12_024097 [Ceratobasidium sp. 428]|nr:hypothetical protein FRC12_024097 [Ceratobasidium sp. 428]
MDNEYHNNRAKKFPPLQIQYSTPAGLPATFGVKSLHNWASRSGSSVASSPASTRSTLCAQSRMHLYAQPSSLAESRNNTELLPEFGHHKTYEATMPASLYSSKGLKKTNTLSMTADDGASVGDDTSVIEVTDDEQSTNRPPFVYLNTMAKESKGKRRVSRDTNNKRTTVKKTKPSRGAFHVEQRTSEETYDEYMKRRAQEAQVATHAASEHSVASTSTKVLKKMVSQLQQQASGTGAQIDLLMSQLYQTQNSAPVEDSPWTGATQGRSLICPCVDGDKIRVLWTFSNCSINHQDPNHRTVGDIHFSYARPPTSTTTPIAFTYWVCTQKPGAKNTKVWERYEPGQSHPVYGAYVLNKRVGAMPPSWVQI